MNVETFAERAIIRDNITERAIIRDNITERAIIRDNIIQIRFMQDFFRILFFRRILFNFNHEMPVHKLLQIFCFIVTSVIRFHYP